MTSQSIRGEYAVQLLLARQPETRSLVESIDGRYITDTLGVIANKDDTIHRWIIELSSPDIPELLATGFSTALKEEIGKDPAVQIENNYIVVEW